MSTYEMHCTVCKESFPNPVQWKAHLPGLNHQRKAQLACRRWNAAVKRCVLVAFGSCPVVECDLINKLSQGMKTIVTDFVWWKKRPLVGLLQFESRAKAEEVLQRTRSEVGVSDGNRVQLKRAADYLELEWNVLLSLSKTEIRSDHNKSFEEFTDNPPVKLENVEENEEDSAEVEIEDSITAPFITTQANHAEQIAEEVSPDSVVASCVLDQEPTQSQDEADEKPPRLNLATTAFPDLIILSSDTEEEPEPFEDNSTTKPKKKDTKKISAESRNAFAHFFQSEILIPQDQYEACNQLITMLETKFRETAPWVKIVPYRHYYLGINNCGSNELLLFLDYKQYLDPDKPILLDAEVPEIVSLFFSSPRQVFRDVAKNGKPSKEPFGKSFIHKPTKLKFRINYNLISVPEVQTCLLLKQLCQFSPTLLPLLGLVNYWVKLNKLKIGILKVTDPQHPNIIPLPASIDWLVILFLVNKKEIPSPLQFLNRPHKEIPSVFGNDVGFSTDIQFLNTWKNNRKQETVDEQLAQMYDNASKVYMSKRIHRCFAVLHNFFNFYGRLNLTPNMVLECNDGTITEEYGKFRKRLIHPINPNLILDFSDRLFFNSYVSLMLNSKILLKSLINDLSSGDCSKEILFDDYLKVTPIPKKKPVPQHPAPVSQTVTVNETKHRNRKWKKKRALRLKKKEKLKRLQMVNPSGKYKKIKNSRK